MFANYNWVKINEANVYGRIKDNTFRVFHICCFVHSLVQPQAELKKSWNAESCVPMADTHFSGDFIPSVLLVEL